MTDTRVKWHMTIEMQPSQMTDARVKWHMTTEMQPNRQMKDARVQWHMTESNGAGPSSVTCGLHQWGRGCSHMRTPFCCNSTPVCPVL